MRIVTIGLAASAAALMLSGCSSGGLFGRDRPDEFAVARTQPLVVPPDFALAPPKPGEPSPQAVDDRNKAIEALFGGPAPRSAAEKQILSEASSRTPAALGARSVAGDPGTNVVDKGPVTQAILAAPQGPGQEAQVSTPQ